MNLAEKILFEAIKKNSSENVENALLAGANIEALNDNGCSPLNYAASLGFTNVIKLLIEYGANLKVKNDFLSTPLHFAVKNNNLEAVTFLVENGCTLNEQDHFGFTPLHVAAVIGNTLIANYLISKGSDANISTYNGWLPLHLSASTSNISMVELLTQHCDINQKDNIGSTPLSISLVFKNRDTAKYLLSKGSSLTKNMILEANDLEEGLGTKLHELSFNYLNNKAKMLANTLFQLALPLVKLPDFSTYIIAKITSYLDKDNLINCNSISQIADLAVNINFNKTQLSTHQLTTETSPPNRLMTTNNNLFKISTSAQQVKHLKEKVLLR